MKQKPIILIALCLILLMTMTACGKDDTLPSVTDAVQNPSTQTAPGTETGTGENKILIAYFSVPEDVSTDGVDAVAGASIVVKDGEKLGNTQYVAQLIHDTIGGDLFRIKTVSGYPLEHDALLDYASNEQSSNARPELTAVVENFAEYDTILLGYPNWWYDMPMPIYTFLESYDFAGKTIIPFVTHGGSRASGSLETIAELAPDAVIYEEPLILSRNEVAGSEETVGHWAESLGLKSQTRKPNSSGDTVLTATVTPNETQVLYLWEADKMPCPREYGEGYFDPPGFRPTITSVPVAEGVDIKGAVLLCAGGAFQFRGNEWDCYPTADRLTEMGYQCFVVDYRLRPYTQEEGALDLARAVRFVRQHAEDYGIDPQDIAVVGYSAGGILCGEMVLNWKGDVTPDVLDANYAPDSLDAVSADVAGIGHIYSFYGRLSVGSTDVEKFRESDLPPTFYAYGTEDPFYRQFMANADAVREAGVEVEEHCYDGQPHGFGAGTAESNWTPEFDRWFGDICANN